MCEEELVVLYNIGDVYYCKRQQFGYNTPEANEAHKAIRILEKDIKNKIIDVAKMTSEDINGLLGTIDKEINGLAYKAQALLESNSKEIQDKDYTGSLRYLSNLRKIRNEIEEYLKKRGKQF